MSSRTKFVRRSRFFAASLVFLSTLNPFNYSSASPGLIRVQQSLSSLPDLVGDLFPSGPATAPTGSVVTSGTTTTGSECPDFFCTTPTGSGTVGDPYGYPFPYPGYRQYDPRTMSTSDKVDKAFQCNLFETPPIGEVLSSINALNAVVTSPACDGKVNLQSVVENNNKIAQIVKDFRQYVDHPELITSDKDGEIASQVDLAIQSAASVAATFANTAAFSKKCRDGMDPGKVATSISSLINGLTPYALMASSLTGGTAAVPFIVGGAVLTGAISSIGQIIDQNTVNIDDDSVRHAVVENTCQYIRLEQKYRFLNQPRQQQLNRINQDIRLSESMFSAKIKALSPTANALLARENAIDLTTREINGALRKTAKDFDADKVFFAKSANDQTMCNFGVEVAKTIDDKTSYASVMLGTLGQAMAVYGKSSGVQAATLQTNAQMAVTDLKAYAAKATRTVEETKACAETAKYFVKTIGDSASISLQLLKIAKAAVETELKNTTDYGLLSSTRGELDEKKIQALRVINSLDAMKTFADTMTRAEIDNSMKNIRESLLSRNYKVLKSPVEKWFVRSEKLHNAAVSDFAAGLVSLRQMAANVGSAPAKTSRFGRFGFAAPQRAVAVNADAQQLKPFTLKNLPLESDAHRNVCRELQGVWDQYGIAVRQLASMNAFCGLIEPYLLDTRKEDQELVAWCRGDRNQPKSVSKILTMKNKLITKHRRDWAVFLTRKMKELACMDPTSAL